MKKAITFVLAVMLVLSMAVPTFAATSSPKAPAASETTTASKPEVVVDTKAEVKVELVAVEEVEAALEAEEKETFVAAQETLKEAAPADMKTQYFCYFKAETKDGKKADEPVKLTIKIANVTKVVVKQFVDGKWVELKATLNEDGTVVIEGLVDGPIAIFTK